MSGFTTEQQEIILHAIRKYFPNSKVSVFGSRKGETFRKDSDLDLLVDTKEKNDLGKKGLLRDQLENDTRIPFRVDLVFKDQIAEDFLSKIEPDLESWS